jgi:hypothetical protein
MNANIAAHEARGIKVQMTGSTSVRVHMQALLPK